MVSHTPSCIFSQYKIFRSMYISFNLLTQWNGLVPYAAFSLAFASDFWIISMFVLLIP